MRTLLHLQSLTPDTSRLSEPHRRRENAHSRTLWVSASGSSTTLQKKAVHYLRALDHRKSQSWDIPLMSLGKAVCNLRYYYRQSPEQTVWLVQTFFCPRIAVDWTAEEIRTVWEAVEGFTPTLGLADARAKAKKRAVAVETEVAEFLAGLPSGGKVASQDLFRSFRRQFPDLPVTPKAFGVAVKSVSGLESRPWRGSRYYRGIHLPEPIGVTALDAEITAEREVVELPRTSEGCRNMIGFGATG